MANLHSMIMIRILFIFIFLPLNGIVAQSELLNNSLIDSTLPVAYRVAYNKIVVKGFEMDTTIQIISLSDTIHLVGGYFPYLGSKMNTDTLKAIKDGKVITQKIYNIENLREPKIFLGRIRDTLVTVKDILRNNALLVSYEPQHWIACTYVTQFYGRILKRNGKEIDLRKKAEKENNSMIRWSDEKFEKKFYMMEKRMERGVIEGVDSYFNEIGLSDKQLNYVKRMKSDDVLSIDLVVLQCSSCIARKMVANLRLRIK